MKYSRTLIYLIQYLFQIVFFFVGTLLTIQQYFVYNNTNMAVPLFICSFFLFLIILELVPKLFPNKKRIWTIDVMKNELRLISLSGDVISIKKIKSMKISSPGYFWIYNVLGMKTLIIESENGIKQIDQINNFQKDKIMFKEMKKMIGKPVVWAGGERFLEKPNYP